MGRTLFDSESMTKAALFGGEEGWFDAFWLADRPRNGVARFEKLAGALRHLVIAFRVLLSRRIHIRPFVSPSALAREPLIKSPFSEHGH